MERQIILQVSRQGRAYASIKARQYGTDEWHVAEEFEITAQIPLVIQAQEEVRAQMLASLAARPGPEGSPVEVPAEE